MAMMTAVMAGGGKQQTAEMRDRRPEDEWRTRTHSHDPRIPSLSLFDAEPLVHDLPVVRRSLDSIFNH